MIILAFSVSLDAFAISICIGLSTNKKIDIIPAISFGIFQIVLFFIGVVFASSFEKYIVLLDHWIAFSLLLFIGGNILIDKTNYNIETNITSILILSLATSIDALAVGIAYLLAYDIYKIIPQTILIGTITFAMCILGSLLGKKYSNIDSTKSKRIGGIILIILAFKILIEHLI